MAQQVCTTITSMFIDENVHLRQQHSEDTTQFLAQQLTDAKSKLDEQDAKLAAFKTRKFRHLVLSETFWKTCADSMTRNFLMRARRACVAASVTGSARSCRSHSCSSEILAVMRKLRVLKAASLASCSSSFDFASVNCCARKLGCIFAVLLAEMYVLVDKHRRNGRAYLLGHLRSV